MSVQVQTKLKIILNPKKLGSWFSKSFA